MLFYSFEISLILGNFMGLYNSFFGRQSSISYKESSCLKDHASVNIWFWVICLNKLNKFSFFDFISLILALPVSTMDSSRNILVSLFQQSVVVTRYEPEKAVDVDFLPFMN